MGKRNRICTVDNCDRPAPYKLYCTKHYQQVKIHGRIKERPKMHDWCTAPGCNSRANRKVAGLCEKHYMRLRRNGTFESIQPRVPDKECITEGCSARAYRVDGLCRNCSVRLMKNGSVERHVGSLHPIWREFDSVSYRTVHQRIRARRGFAKDRKCVDCGGRAAHWSYNNRSPVEREGANEGRAVRYSPLLCDYEPRCVSCHKQFDLAARRFSWERALPAKRAS